MNEQAKKGKIWCLSLILIFFSLTSNINVSGSEICMWTDKTIDLKNHFVGRIQWPDKSEINGFFPIGFSKDGWFAYSENLEKIESNEPLWGCLNPPCYDIIIFNIECEEECLTDAPIDENDKCYCIYGIEKNDLTKYEITPLEKPLYGLFPIKIMNDSYDIELAYKEKGIYPIVLKNINKWEPEFPETIIYLISKKFGRKKIGSIDHNKSNIRIGVRPAGWIKNPFSDSVVILILCEIYDYDKNNILVICYYPSITSPTPHPFSASGPCPPPPSGLRPWRI